jgi:hypothetical protein
MNPVVRNGSFAFHLDSSSFQSDAISIYSTSDDIVKSTLPVVCAVAVVHVNEYHVMGGWWTSTTAGGTAVDFQALYSRA